jgi:hypothetical protein
VRYDRLETDRDLYRFDEPYGRPRRRTNFFAWTVAILLFTGFAFAAWLGSFYIFGQPERPDSYRILKKLHKIEQPKRFELTAAPAGEFLSAKQLYDRYAAMVPAELAEKNAELARNYIRNYQQVRGLVPYVVGRFTIMEARELTSTEIFTSGMVALASSVEHGELLMEHVYPAEQQDLALMRQTLVPGLEIKLERTHDLSSVIHAERLADGRVMITTIPLLYGTYTVTRGTGTFTLEPPLDLNLAAGWPIFKESKRRLAEVHYDSYRTQVAPQGQNAPIAGLPQTSSPPPAQNELVPVEQAQPIATPQVAIAPSKNQKGKPTPTPKGTKVAKNQKATPAPAPEVSRAPIAVAEKQNIASPPPPPVASAPAKPPPPPAARSTTPAVAAATPPPPSAAPVQVLPAQPATGEALASTAGVASWKTFPPGKMPAGRLVGTADLKELADRGIVGERYYLRGQFVVNVADANRAVMRPRSKLTDTVLHFGSGGNSTRVIVDFPAGYVPPQQGAVVNRDENRPYEITEVRKQSDGQVNVFVREIIQ